MIKNKQIEVMYCECEKCSHEWMPLKGLIPEKCPKCKFKKWNANYERMSEKYRSKIDSETMSSLDKVEEKEIVELKIDYNEVD